MRFTQCNLDLSDFAQTFFINYVPNRISLHALGLLQGEGGTFLPSRPLLPFWVIWGRCQVLIYLFRDERTGNRALTMDVTGRNIPLATSSTVWQFVEMINTRDLPLRWNTEYLRYAVRQVGITGFHLFEPGWERPPPPQAC